jgi:hypothetical protein
MLSRFAPGICRASSPGPLMLGVSQEYERPSHDFTPLGDAPRFCNGAAIYNPAI